MNANFQESTARLGGAGSELQVCLDQRTRELHEAQQQLARAQDEITRLKASVATFQRQAGEALAASRQSANKASNNGLLGRLFGKKSDAPREVAQTIAHPSVDLKISNRDEFPALLDRLGRNGLAIELGVAAGGYSEQLLRHGKMSVLFSVDRWSDHHNDAECEHARRVLSQFGCRSVVLRMTFEQALPIFADGVFDFIFIDGYAHTGQDGISTLDSWWPKMRSGGIFAGHDYHPRWPLTMEVVDQFVAKHGLKLFTTDEQPELVEHAYPSWYVMKP
ncbi:class I SAM-dependent methyltransferase [Tuwongella immobilis]|uniref:Methyltransferase domain-containing protein n=1 Tax=Tuwongella immobilis TaxID=692036 RepID=A0A6C2YKC2_9BACT|nr:class I SAM-dependent methyltransferase [Tuwongella immobilis]VIP01679.1 Uncharacterized protein OS=Thiocystis violascens (strain ATCC 17096 / DSM 198 / 6111) GN=Thivi_0126 PE=4 SV=1: Methyltransf_24 [Tuwongella immobilis]VTR99125.1 Uncharacterized protein OS=Thiocystis violascens (strain ATCC 17096 / DSM 198 / 6111) GN=Thivi_0126 PE=4 SV=1: Methyltransf_24 [Tuwongella immobilis]